MFSVFVVSMPISPYEFDYDYPNASNTIFYLASVSKQFTAMAMALLEEQGKISLDDDIRKYFPENDEPKGIKKRNLLLCQHRHSPLYVSVKLNGYGFNKSPFTQPLYPART